MVVSSYYVYLHALTTTGVKSARFIELLQICAPEIHRITANMCT